ncbi:hypothetical protein H0H93_005187, partial [Arthromyces matolae]
MNCLRSTALSALCSLLLTASCAVAVVFGPISTSWPAPAGGAIANDQPPNSFFQGFSPPFPTNDWWVGFGAGTGDAVVAGPFPYSSSLTATAIQFGISASRDFDGVSIHQPTQADWAIRFVEHNGNGQNHKALSWDSQSVTVQYFTGASTMTSYLVPGSPYLTFSFSGATPVLTSRQGAITSFNGQTLGTGASDYVFSGDVGTLRFTWNVVGNAANLLMLTWPHHRIKMQNPNFPSTNSLSYLTTKGYMYPALENMWSMAYNLTTITWNAPRLPDASCSKNLIAGLPYEIANLPAVTQNGDFYFFGGHLAAVSRLALIAEVVGRNDLVQTVVNWLEGSIGYLFNSATTAVPAYETGWGGIINRAGYNNVWVDYGNGYYNDHHFHYGYILAAAAVIA